MGLFDLFRSKPAAEPKRAPRADWQAFTGLDDPRLAAFLQSGAETASGAVITPSKALFNTAVFRCIDLISGSIGMLPMYLLKKGANGQLEPDEEHPLYDVLYSEPNGWQTAYEFRRLMQANVLNEGNAYAQIVRSGRRVIGLHPLRPSWVVPEQKNDLSVIYKVTRKDGRYVELPQSEVFHLRDLTSDGLIGLSRTHLAKEAIGLAMQTEQSAARLFKNGTMVGGALTHPGKLGDEGFENLDASIKEKFSGAENAHKWLILEEGMEAKPFSPSARDSQQVETRNHQIEEIARAFGVPRPLLMMDDTSWGSGIETLGLFFVKYALAPWFVAWEQAVSRSLLAKDERKTHKADFDERELLRGSTKDQAEFLAKALGSGGARGWMTQNEARDYVGLSQSGDAEANSLKNPMTQPASPAGSNRESTNEPK